MKRNQETPLPTGNLDQTPPTGLKRRVMAELAADGRLALLDRRTPVITGALGFAAGIVLAVWGLVLTTDGSRPPQPTHALLLYDTPAIRSQPPAKLVREYGEWARSLARRGLLSSAEELDRGQWLGAGPGDGVPPLTPSGFFLVATATQAEAIALARSSPHRRHGGWIEVRPIVAH